MPALVVAEPHDEVAGLRGVLQKASTMHLRTHKTKIVATIGPASSSPSVIGEMVRAGMDIARLNFSHGEFDDHRRNIESLRAPAQAAGRDVAILADAGPGIRLSTIEGERRWSSCRTNLRAHDRGRSWVVPPRLPSIFLSCFEW